MFFYLEDEAISSRELSVLWQRYLVTDFKSTGKFYLDLVQYANESTGDNPLASGWLRVKLLLKAINVYENVD